jgi:hypothetical protein
MEVYKWINDCDLMRLWVLKIHMIREIHEQIIKS